MTPDHLHPAGRIVRVRTEVAALSSKEFDYVVPPSWTDPVMVGTRVRVPLHGRSVRGWVVAADVGPTVGLDVRPLKSWLGWGPPPGVVELAAWAGWRWAGPESGFLQSASPKAIVRSLPAPAGHSVAAPPVSTAGPSRFWSDIPVGAGTTMVRLPPATDLIDLVIAAAAAATAAGRPEPGHTGSVLVLVPSVGWADRLCARLTRRGLAATTEWTRARAGWPIVVGSRAGAWAPVPHLAAVLVLDAHDSAYREESAPTYSAVDVAIERARRSGVPCVLTSPVPPVTLPGVRTLAPSEPDERSGWPAVERVDRRGADPRTGLFSDEFVRLARTVLQTPNADDGTTPLVCVYNRKGGARLLACSNCGELARCLRCGAAAAATPDKTTLVCPRCGERRPLVCSSCGRLRTKTLRAGVTQLREEISALLGVGVEEVSGPASRPAPEHEHDHDHDHDHEHQYEDDAGHEAHPRATTAAPPTPPQEARARVLVGTEAVLHRVRRAAAVVFLDIDLHLLAPRLTAFDESLALLVRAGRLVGARRSSPPWGRVQVQTRVPDHPVLEAAVRGEPAPALAEETSVRRASGLPPFSALALVSGPLASTYADAVALEAARTSGEGTLAVTATGENAWLVTAPDHRSLCDLLARVERPQGRGLRIAVDPPSF